MDLAENVSLERWRCLRERMEANTWYTYGWKGVERAGAAIAQRAQSCVRARLCIYIRVHVCLCVCARAIVEKKSMASLIRNRQDETDRSLQT